MVDSGECHRLAQEAAPYLGLERLTWNLDRDRPPRDRMNRGPHGAHATLAEQPGQPISLSQNHPRRSPAHDENDVIYTMADERRENNQKRSGVREPFRLSAV